MKKFLALALSLCLILGMTSFAAAEATPTKLTLWTFIAQHDTYYYGMADDWNAAHPDEPIELECVTLGYDDMHNKFKVALAASGEGAPDIVDVELGQFPNILAYSDYLVPMDEYLGDLKNDLVEARLKIYSKGGVIYGVPYHVGATVTFYNVDLLDAAGIDYTAIKTWDDWREAGLKLKEANPGVYMGNVETTANWQAGLMLTQLDSEFQDNSDESNPVPTINTEAMLKLIQTQQGWLNDGIAVTCPGGQVDTEEGKAWVATGVCASVTMPLWYMSRFVDEIGENCKGKYAIAPSPVFEEGQNQSVGGGGTGTVVCNANANADLAARFVVFAKGTKEANIKIWEDLGFDPCNKEVWTMTEVTHNPENKYNQYFVTNAFDTLLAINEVGFVASTSISPTINTYLVSTLWNEVYVDMADAATALEEAQEAIESELF